MNKFPRMFGVQLHSRPFLNRLNAVWFRGKITREQLYCLSIFAMIFQIKNQITREPVPVSWLAYVLATTYHETAATMRPIAEYGLGKGRSYGEPDPQTGQTYYGRGYVQLTWKENYQKAQEIVMNPLTLEHDVPFVMQPDLAMSPGYATQIAIGGMINGWFTGKKLGDYLTRYETDYVNARRIINGTDRAEQIAALAREAEMAVRLAQGERISRCTLSNESQGSDVRELQLLLGEEPDGIFGGVTELSLMNFQLKHNLEPDGICGPVTWDEIDKTVYGSAGDRLLVT